MKRADLQTAPAADLQEFLWLGGHPAMDLLNTVAVLDGKLVDLWASDRDVLRWLRCADLLHEPVPASLPRGLLLQRGRELRLAIRGVVEARSAGTRPEVARLNRFLAAGQRSLHMTVRGRSALKLFEQGAGRLPERLLVPAAESAARLIATARPQHLRRCEGSDCVLWFVDETPRQRRRWCSMEICGNRAKVAAFRARHAR